MRHFLPSVCLLGLMISAHAQDAIYAQVGDTIILQSELSQKQSELTALAGRQNIALPNPRQSASDALIADALQANLLKRADLKINDQIIDAQLLGIAKQMGYADIEALIKGVGIQTAAAMRADLVKDAALGTLAQNQVATRLGTNARDVALFLDSQAGQNFIQGYAITHLRVPYTSNDRSAIAQSEQVANALIRALTQGQSVQHAIASTQRTDIEGGQIPPRLASDLPEGLGDKIMAMQVGETIAIAHQQGVDVIRLDDKAPLTVQDIQWKARHILVKDEKSAQAIWQQLQQGADFSTLARTHSLDKGSAAQGGDLGWAKIGQMVAPFEHAMQTTPKGTYSRPFASEFGYHIVMIDDVRQQDVSANARTNAVYDHLYRQSAPMVGDDWLATLKQSTYIKIYE